MPFHVKKIQYESKFWISSDRVIKSFGLFLGLFLLVIGCSGCSGTDPVDEYLVMAEEAEEAESDVVIETEEIPMEGPAKQALFVVHIYGAVKEPGVYELDAESRVIDAVDAAGGFSLDAAKDARNLAEHIADGVMIRIPTVQEFKQEQALESKRDPSGISGGQQNLQEDLAEVGLVNINTATAEMLQTLPGIGESKAEAIIAYRRDHGAFSCIEDIMKVSGIKQAAFEKLKDQITV